MLSGSIIPLDPFRVLRDVGDFIHSQLYSALDARPQRCEPVFAQTSDISFGFGKNVVRRSLPDELKRKQIAVRLGPSARERVARQAEANGNSIGAEIEQLAMDQLAYLEGVDEPTRELLAAVSDEIVAITAEFGKDRCRWHNKLEVWAAVLEMFRNGPITERNPDPKFADDVVNEGYAKIFAIEQQKRQIADELKAMGVTISPENPRKHRPRNRGLFGSLRTATVSVRQSERAMIDALLQGQDREDALRLFEKVEALDLAEQAANDEWTEALRPYWEAEAKGRDLYRSMLKTRAKRARAEGKDYNMRHLMGWFD